MTKNVKVLIFNHINRKNKQGGTMQAVAAQRKTQHKVVQGKNLQLIVVVEKAKKVVEGEAIGQIWCEKKNNKVEHRILYMKYGCRDNLANKNCVLVHPMTKKVLGTLGQDNIKLFFYGEIEDSSEPNIKNIPDFSGIFTIKKIVNII